ncbi:TPA: ABC-F family ATP-binding cassette domain-containing protein [Enterococcus faecium]|uniref:ABC-F family ATP-binding cassette domain-containing protein n=1 Tax=Enterococcus faecium TaxID=1352 RepID=UPI0002A35274|nr:ABC-F family ATP-binding cassette domain-containing protein [Enterococcus faecium]ELA87296.1 ABC transporter ATP-binding protein [Enterococcus faecium EnGen0016]HAQ4791852.1 ABC-F family ATP-binding cassette domain-containing protein [Enterococcus faecium]HAQ5465569.1 ABC-F family ATP-binding cassette domain-containing protein [Enterococcus faecium]HAQ5569937.1 ABC-F family ATP-binding cassette domain-containing protein [Enterococcus faecium]HAQ5927345.1 ABC-F family ATP-binding cassette do
MILLQANQIARHFGAEVLFENIHLEISTGARVALVGRNGAGKSTLLKIIAGIEAPDEGKIAKNKTATLGYLAQDTGLDSNETVWNEMLKAFEQVRQMEERMRELEIFISEGTPDTPAYSSYLKEYDRLQHDFSDRNGYGYENEIRSVLHGFKFDSSFYDQKIDTLSGGQRTRLALARMLLQHPDILILDEPTNHLDIETLSWLENYLQSYTGALLIVSHDRYFLDKVVNEVYELSRRKMRHYKGNYSKYLDLKAEQLASEWKAYEKQQTEIHKLEDFVARNLVRASTTKRAQSRRKTLEKMDRLDRPQGDEKQANFLFSIEKPSGNVVLQIEDAAIGYDNVTLSEPINLDIRRQEAIALVGPNGIGKSTLLKSIIHQIPFIRGKETLGTNVTIGYYDQGQADLHTNKTILAELWDEHPTTPEKEIRSPLGAFLFSGEDVEKPIPLLSGGEKARVALAKLAMNKENFLILDEPTNHLDIDNKEVLENALIDYDGTLLFVSHDRYFINRIATKVVELSENGSKVYLGDYDYYLEKKQEEEEIAELLAQDEPESAPAPTNKSDYYQSKEQQKLIRSLQRKITQVEEEMARIDEWIDQLEQEMVAPENLEDHVKLNELNQDLEAARQDQETKLTEWEELSLELEEYEN